jgi:hypothetical protein
MRGRFTGSLPTSRPSGATERRQNVRYSARRVAPNAGDDVVEEHDENAFARAKVLVGRPDEAIDHIRRAVELHPDLREHAATDDDFSSLRDRPDWPP